MDGVSTQITFLVFVGVGIVKKPSASITFDESDFQTTPPSKSQAKVI